jgi:putative spermidine/putrescine transport system permease protein
MSIFARIRRIPFWSWLWFILGALYFLLPLYATVNFSLRMERDVIGFKAYVERLKTPDF